MRILLSRLAVIMIAALAGLPTLAAATAAEPVVFAAASLKNALDDAVALYADRTGNRVVVNYAGSSALARQIEAAAPADIFFSANLDWMDYLDELGLIRKESRTTLLGNAIVLVAPKDTDAAIEIAAGMDLVRLLGADGRIAMANVDSVPAGEYGKAALEHFGIWDSLADRIVQADNVRAALAFVASGEVPLGIVYATDAVAEPDVRIVGTFPDDSHSPVLYPLALTASSTNPAAVSVIEFLKSPAARPSFEKQGFVVLTQGS